MAKLTLLKNREGDILMSKRSIGLVLVLSMVMVMAFAGVAMAAQIKVGANGSDTKDSYLPTPKTFTKDDNSLYPNEIYLPSESAPANYRIHSNYTKNTDACAACHATHTAVGAALLQWANVYEACMACHDGTVSATYNVKGGYIADTGSRTFGGMFGTGTESSWSNHNVTGAVEIAAAPGGTTVNNANEVDPVHNNAPAAWVVEFGCQSCHSPHGQGANARILNADPNGQSWEKYNVGTTKKVQLIAATETKTGYNAFKIDTSNATYADLGFILKGYPYSKQTKLYQNDKTTAINGVIFDNTNSTYTVVYVPDSVDPGVYGPFYLDYVPALRVKMTISNYLQATESVSHVSGLNNFCGACHTDYNTEDEAKANITPSEELNGEYSEAYRHKVGFNQFYRASTFTANGLNMPLESGNMTCETCHYAHGTTKDFWNATQAVNNAYRPGGVSGDWGDEIAGSSALKRLPNMGTCEACHVKGDGNEGYSPVVGATATTSVTQSGATFIGSAACGACHESHYTGWQDTLHSKMIGQGPGTVLAAAKDNATTFKGGTNWKGNRSGITYGPDQVVLTIGTKWKQRYLVGDANNGYEFLEKQYNVKYGTWEGYSNTAKWDQMCTTCHVTGYKINSISWTGDTTTGEITAIDDTWAELNVGCEACHGPGSNHQKAPSTTNIKNPAKQSFADQAKACGYCHLRGQSSLFYTDKVKTQFAGEASAKKLYGREDLPAPLGETFIPFENMDYENWGIIAGITPGITHAQGTAAITVNGQAYPEAGSIYNATPDAAGRYVESKHHQQYQGLLQSRHLTQNVLTCATCHSSHSRNSSKEQLKLTGAQTCGSCHGGVVTSGSYSIPANPSIDTYMKGTGGTLSNVAVRSHVFSPDAPNWTYSTKDVDVANP